MIRDPLQEVLEVALRTPDDAGPDDLDPVQVADLVLARRRFGVALPPPYAPRPAEPAHLPIRPGGPLDSAALAVVQRRAWRSRYRGLLPDALLDGLDFSSLGPAWVERAAVADGSRRRLLVAGRPGEAHAMVVTGPADRVPDVVGRGDGDGPGQVRALDVDPSVTGRGLGSALLGAAVDALGADGFAEAVSWVAERDIRARALFERWGWRPDGGLAVTEYEGHPLAELRYRRSL